MGKYVCNTAHLSLITSRITGCWLVETEVPLSFCKYELIAALWGWLGLWAFLMNCMDSIILTHYVTFIWFVCLLRYAARSQISANYLRSTMLKLCPQNPAWRVSLIIMDRCLSASGKCLLSLKMFLFKVGFCTVLETSIEKYFLSIDSLVKAPPYCQNSSSPY